MAEIKQSSTLKDFQAFVQQTEEERGFASETLLQKCLLLGEEVGELFKAVRKLEEMKTDDQSTYTKASHEVADIFIVLTAIANRLEIDFEQTIKEKEALNKQRTWN